MQSHDNTGRANPRAANPRANNASSRGGASEEVLSWPALDDAVEYCLDAWQRAFLYLDVMRCRAEQHREHAASIAPNVLDYRAELVCDGRELPRPVNYFLVRIVPSAEQASDPAMRPFVIVDPRAGHGPGIGGFKPDSEIGVALKAGHPCYFIGFLPEPIPGQTIEDIVEAEASFIEAVIARHPEAEAKPCVIGNCQAGWAVMMLASVRPELFGPIILAGTPLSYWAGVHGQFPMRYSGGLLGGSWLTALTSDLGRGKFDGVWLVQNFENQNPANTLWTKQYNLFSKVDKEAERYLGFERWWGGHVSLNAEEMQFIVDELFVGNKLAAGEICMRDGTAVDLRNIRSPIVVLCSKGDNITPPQQALGWILDMYSDVDDLRRRGQTIVYSIHEKIGHLGIFVSGGVARKEHDEFANNIDLIDVLPPGLYEAIFEPKGAAVENPDLITGEWIMRCEQRTLDDIRALGGNDAEDDRKFAAAARLSEINLALYKTFARPVVQAMVSPWLADTLQRLHPLRLQQEFLGPDKPAAPWIQGTAEIVRNDRRMVSPDNIWLGFQEQISKQIVDGLEQWRCAVEWMAENTFHAVYGAPALQAALGIDKDTNRKAARSLVAKDVAAARIAQLRARISRGGMREAVARSLIYVGMARGGADERGFEAIRRLRRSRDDTSRMSLSDFKAMMRDQFEMLILDQRAAVAAIADLLPPDPRARQNALRTMDEILQARGKVAGLAAERLAEIAGIFQAEQPGRTSTGARTAAAKTDTVIQRRSTAERATEALDEAPPRGAAKAGQGRRGREA